MLDIVNKSSDVFDKNSILSINGIKIQEAKSKNTIQQLNLKGNNFTNTNQIRSTAPPNSISVSQPISQTASQPVIQSAPPINKIAVPKLQNLIKKGQKAPLENTGKLSKIKACFGWNVNNSECDVDTSAFLLSGNKILGDDWFVFYGQTESPDKSVSFMPDIPSDRQAIIIDFTKLNAQIDKIVFVLTINEALLKHLNFSMLKDAYIRIIDPLTNKELVSFMMDEYYDNVTSMMIGEVYKYNNTWKFNAIGNGVARDLAGLCEFYGVQVV